MNNKKSTSLTIYGFTLLIVIAVIFAISGSRIFNIKNEVTYSISLIIILFSVWRISVLHLFYMEVSEHVLSVKYHHPLIKSNKPVLEVPLQKVVSFKIERGLMTYHLIISINTRRGIRNFYYKLGTIPEKNIEKIDYISTFIQRSRIKFENNI